MFTGIIEDIGTVVSATDSQIKINTNLTDIKIGDSVAVNGVCLTVTEIAGRQLCFDYSPTTGSVTNISMLQKNFTVNLERALQINSRLGGHIVSGHVDATAKIIGIKNLERFYNIVFENNDKINKYTVDKGFICVDGVSLTLAQCAEFSFGVTMIPETFCKTVFKNRKIGDIVNIELDILAKYVEKMLNKNDEKKTDVQYLDILKENGFM